MKGIIIGLLSLFLILSASGCTNPLPVLISLSPMSKVSHLPTFTLTVTGTDFISESKIVFNGVEKPTTYVSSTELTCEIDPDDIALGPATIPVLVRTPSPGGGDSESANFEVLENHSFTSPVQISFTGKVWSNDIAVDASGRVHVVWGYSNWKIGQDGKVYYRRSPDSGNTWDSTQLIHEGLDWSERPWYPHIGADNSGNVYVVGWHGLGNGYSGSVYFIRSSDDGSTWGPVISPFGTDDGWYTRLAVDGSGNIHIFVDHASGGSAIDVCYSRSSDQGGSWSGLMNLSGTPDIYSGWFDEQRIAVDPSGNVSVVWEEEESPLGHIKFRRSIDNGSSWGNKKNIFTIEKKIQCFSADHLGNLNLLFYEVDSGDADLFLTRSTDGGNTWSYPVKVYDSPNNNYGTMAIDTAGNINVVFSGGGSYFVRSIDNGFTWSSPINITSFYIDRNIAVDTTGNIYMLFISDYDLYFCRSEL